MTIDSNILGGKKAVNWEGIFKTGIPLSTYFTKRSPEAIQMHASDLPEKIRSLNKTSPMNILPRLGATKSPRGPQNSQREQALLFCVFQASKGKREASEERQTRATGESFSAPPSVTRVSSPAPLLARFARLKTGKNHARSAGKP